MHNPTFPPGGRQAAQPSLLRSLENVHRAYRACVGRLLEIQEFVDLDEDDEFYDEATFQDYVTSLTASFDKLARAYKRGDASYGPENGPVERAFIAVRHSEVPLLRQGQIIHNHIDPSVGRCAHWAIGLIAALTLEGYMLPFDEPRPGANGISREDLLAIASSLRWLRKFDLPNLYEQMRFEFVKALEKLEAVNLPASSPTVRERAQVEAQPEEGPSNDNGFRFCGRHVRLSPLEWEVVDYLWKSPNRQAKRDDVAIAVWNDEEAAGNPLKQTAKRIANKFCEAEVPISIQQFRQWICLKVHL